MSADEGDSLLHALRRREPEACQRFAGEHYRHVYRFFLWLTNDPDAASDLTQETFVGFWGSLERVQEGRSLRVWLFAIGRNRYRQWLRDTSPTVLSLDAVAEEPTSEPGPEATVLARLDVAELDAAVAQLPPDYREALVLKVYAEMSYGEIASVLGISENLARWRAHQGRKRLRAQLHCEKTENTP